MKNNKNGITVTSITIYIILFFMFTTVTTIISSRFNEDLFNDRGMAINVTAINKLEYNLLKSSVESYDIKIDKGETKTTLSFSNQDTYIFDLDKNCVYKNGGKLIGFLKDFELDNDSQLLNIKVILNKYTNELERTISINNNAKMPYVEDGLLAHYEGINNTGTGVHDNSINTWADISGNNNAAVSSISFVNDGVTSGWTNNGFIFPQETAKTYFTATYLASQYPSMTVEFVMTPLTVFGNTGADYVVPITILNTSGAASLTFYSRKNINLMYGSGGNIIFDTYNTPDLTKDNCHTLTFVQDDLTSRSLYINGKYMFSKTKLSLSNIDFAKLNIKSSAKGSYIIHSVRVYGRGLSAEEVMKNYQIDSLLYREQ